VPVNFNPTPAVYVVSSADIVTVPLELANVILLPYLRFKALSLIEASFT
jgi:hypothetical protein